MWDFRPQWFPAESRMTGAPLLATSPVELWRELARVMLTAHTRRGESDLVAYWLVQVLALDHRAPEWQVMAAD
ncbi:hypothetical protein GPECTOR_62g894 [Gonium pectorale]|uniref:Uncharacterized protein n=1 Tax=Gonium pectorale TaxID=33097 RepID=A0A150G4G5_GONPE|nr:hypothetical protein GPECTOR_62g894 [Gonium pectorale]|eukprot:KXZ44779.1 hypothetical protein GPECTOR_62g894 [Gonium pectorale]